MEETTYLELQRILASLQWLEGVIDKNIESLELILGVSNKIEQQELIK